jgi:hypothetical protein
MASKEDFNAVEWESLAEAPALAGLIVITAQRGGTIRESLAMAKAYAAAGKEHAGHDILGEIVATAPQISPREFKSADELNTQGLQRIQDAVALLESKGATADEVDAYKRFALTVATAVAEADKSGGVLGIGGKRVSETEQAALDRLRETLGLESEAAS